MIFGSTYDSKHARQQDEIRRKIQGQRVFKVLCVLADGRYAFCRYVWEYWDGYRREGDPTLFLEYSNPVRYYLEPKDYHVVFILWGPSNSMNKG